MRDISRGGGPEAGGITSLRSSVPLFGPLVVLIVAVTALVVQMSDPALVTAVAGLLMAISTLIAVILTHGAVGRVEVQTNQRLTDLMRDVKLLQERQATQEEINARQTH
jgi:membrane protein implicated in regulation of membrane protease activity